MVEEVAPVVLASQHVAGVEIAAEIVDDAAAGVVGEHGTGPHILEMGAVLVVDQRGIEQHRVADDQGGAAAGGRMAGWYRPRPLSSTPGAPVPVAIVDDGAELVLDGRGRAGGVGLQHVAGVEIAAEIVDDAAAGVGEHRTGAEIVEVRAVLVVDQRGVEQQRVADDQGGAAAGDEWLAGIDPAVEQHARAGPVAIVDDGAELVLDGRGRAGGVGLQHVAGVEIAAEIVDDAAAGVGEHRTGAEIVEVRAVLQFVDQRRC